MEKKTKTILIVSSVILVTAVASYFLFIHKPPDDSDEGNGENGGNGDDSDNNFSQAGNNVVVKGNYTNTREGSCTDTDIVVKVEGNGKLIGTIDGQRQGCDGKIWYDVELSPDNVEASGYKFWGLYNTEHNHAWVRSDVVNVE